MAVPEDAQGAGATPTFSARLHLGQQLIRDVGVLGRQVVGHPVARQHEITGIASKIVDAQSTPVAKARGAADRVNTAEKSAHPFPFVAVLKFRPASAAAWKYGEAE